MHNINILKQFTPETLRRAATLMERVEEEWSKLETGCAIPTEGAQKSNGAFQGTLREAITKVLRRRKAKSVTQVAEAVEALGFNFNTAKPKNSVGSYLYNKKFFQRARDGRFQPVA